MSYSGILVAGTSRISGGEFYAWATDGFVSVRDVGFGFPLFFALLIEVVSAFGPPTIAAYAEA